MKLSNIKISHKLIGGFVATSLMVGVVGGVGVYNMNSINENSKIISDKKLVEVQSLGSTRASMLLNKASLSELVNKNNQSNINSILSDIDKNAELTNKSLEQYKKVDLTKEELESVKRFEKSVKDYQAERAKVVNAVKEGNYEKAIEISDTTYKEKRDAVLKSIDDKIASVNEESQKMKKENEDRFHSSKLLMNIMMGLGFLGSLGLGIYLSQNLISRLRKVGELSVQLGDGDLTHTIPESGNDEIGQMVTSLNKAVENMRNLVGEIISGSQEMSATTEELSATMEEISASMESVKETTVETTRGIEELSASTEEISASSEEIEHASTDLSTKANEGGQKSEEIKIRADKVKAQAIESAQSAITLYEEKQSKIYQAIEQAKVVSQIGMLADTIGELADQTKLLSLNARIESARAGEAGRGFAVVANEVGNLAEQSNASASNIRQVIAEVQRAFDDMTSISMEVMEFINAQVKPDYELLVEVGDKYQKDAEFVMDMSSEIAISSQAISDSISEVSASLLNVSATTEQTSSGAETVLSSMTMASDSVKEVAYAVQTQAELAEKLSTMAQKFRV